ncbi:hypothetical protein GSY74_10305 [Sulfurovum sp. bin170]|uniref:hypothetical protein n=1 Tax=Sulfurovum sp. bin170 TaxID=2695268 RepID=UPI0013E08E20|nr:hypothetical protein [Sulfurovum sp. bin170]NEW61677.1 hypothetical protein [Sulfurovum sp. bin170]
MRQFFRFSILFVVLLFTACDSGTTSSSTSGDEIEVQTKQSLIDSSQKRFHLELSMKNNYTDGVVAELSNISLDLDDCSISESNLNIVDNRVQFSEPLESRTLLFTVDFTQPCLPTGYTINGNTLLTYEGTSTKNAYQSKFQEITIDGNLTIEDTQSIFEYDVKLESVDDEPKIELDSKKRYKLSLVNFSSGTDVQEDRVHSMTIRSSDPSQVQLIDPNNYNRDQGQAHSELTFNNQNGMVFYIQTYDNSGIANFDVTISYTNNRGEVYDIERRTSVVILSGEPTAFSINDTGVEYNPETKWFTQTFLISASDKYNNIINVPSKINVSAMADFRDNNGKGDRVLYGKFGSVGGELIADKDNHSASFKATKDVFNNIDPERDFLLLFGDATTSEALGKWDIDTYNNSSTVLNLSSAYYGENHTNLGFAVGHNYMNEICSSESKEWELQIDSTDGTYQLDDEGKASVTLKFPNYMIGKKIALSVNFSGKERRAGEVHFQTLYSFNGVTTPEAITIDANTTTPTSMTHFFRVDTGTEDTFMVKNAKVDCITKTENVIITKLIENSPIKNISDCADNGETAYWQLSLELIDLEKAGSFSFEECQVSSFLDEF